MPADRPYHHGRLRRAILDAAVAAIAKSGPAGLSLRDLARRAGVSHAAPSYHFGDKAGLLTAVAVEGYELLARELGSVQQGTEDFLEVGVAYVRFALEHRAHFEVMFRPELYHREDVALLAAKERTSAALFGGAGSLPDDRRGSDVRAAGLAAWSLVHGFASLWLSGALPADVSADPEAAARTVAAVLFREPEHR